MTMGFRPQSAHVRLGPVGMWFPGRAHLVTYLLPFIPSTWVLVLECLRESPSLQ